MSGMFIVKAKVRRDPKTQEERSAVDVLKKDFPYAVLDIWKWHEKREDGTKMVVTKFLIGDQETGLLHWIDSHGVNFVSVI